MKPTGVKILLMWFSLSVLALPGCVEKAEEHEQPRGDLAFHERVGEMCTVHFRHDALGMARDNAVGPMVGTFNDTTLIHSGKLIAETPEWVVLNSDGGDYYINKRTILHIGFQTRQPRRD